MRKILFQITLILFIIIILFGLITLYQSPSEQGDTVSDRKIVRELKREINSFDKIKVDGLGLIKITEEDRNGFGSYKFENVPENEMKDGNVILYVTTRGEKWGDDVKNFEVESVMRAWVYLHNRKYDLPITVVESYHKPAGFITGQLTIVIAKSEFEKYYGDLTDTNLPEAEIAKELTERWVKATGYSRKKETQ